MKKLYNPDYALEQLGETHSRTPVFLYTELRTMIRQRFEQRLEEIVVLAGFFIEVYNAFEGEELPSYREIQPDPFGSSDYSELSRQAVGGSTESGSRFCQRRS